MKRAFDILCSATGIILLLPLFVLAAAAVYLSSGSPVLFRQRRMGKDFRPFTIYKFRTMVTDASSRGGPITFGSDPRVTPFGALLRKLKIDELPQLLNVLKGDMSLVGPRPEMPEFVELFRQDYRVILRIRPGITDLSSLKYLNESEVLERFENPSEAYVRCILPDKISLAKQYVDRSSFLFD
jgi:lipopolysaccharide/colanic/teichoic acid biosynthesis glycosyltransferase